MRGMKESMLYVWYERVSAVVRGMKESVLCAWYERVSAVCVV